MKHALAVMLALLVVGTVTYVTVKQRWEAPLSIAGDGMTVVVERGDSLAAIAYRLEQQGVLAHPQLLRWYGRATGLDQQVKRGEYFVPAGATALALLEQLIVGEVVSYQVTLPEGITLRQAINILQQQDNLLSVLAGPEDPRLLAMVTPHASAEGYFLPETYRYERGDSDLDVLTRARQALGSVLDEAWSERADGLPYETPYEALIMASIIERETGVPEERGEIAGVFVRRLHKGMLLQTDPTVIYGLGEGFDGNLRRTHLRDASNPYNTYRHGGLPPSPIALPGAAAIHAALHPEAGKSLFFVATGDGGHYFSETLAEHNKAVRKYQLKRVSDYRSSPRPKSQ